MNRPVASFSAEDLLVDRSLADVASGFRFLLDLTPVDLGDARDRFLRDHREPVFSYRDLEDDPELITRRLAAIPVDDVRDPTLAILMRAKRRELTLQCEMLAARGSSEFLGLGIELYGTVGPHLLTEAEEILEQVEPIAPTGPWLDADEILRRARRELDLYREACPQLEAKVEMRDGTAGLMVSNGDLLIPPDARVSESRLGPLLHHEIGTHVVTHANGAHQPLRILASGLAGHDETQEGLAVLAEHLTGGLTAGRLRQLAARVVAVHAMVEGAPFADVHDDLVQRGLSPNQAFTATARVFRSGGLTKDAIYLRGLRELVDHLATTVDSLSILWLGKMPLDSVPLVSDLHRRGLLRDPLIVPRFLHDPTATARLGRIATITALTQLIEDHP